MKNFATFLQSSDELQDKWRDSYRELSYSVETFSDGVLTATVKEVEQVGGEGQGDTYYYVYQVECEGVVTYYKLEGWYASHYGATFDDKFDLVEVKKIQVMREEWVEV